jgi:hypothetical protein
LLKSQTTLNHLTKDSELNLVSEYRICNWTHCGMYEVQLILSHGTKLQKSFEKTK